MNMNTDNARAQAMVRPGRTKIDAGLPYQVARNSAVARQDIRVVSDPRASNELGQQVSVGGTESRYFTEGAEYYGVDVDYYDRRESNRNWYGGLYPSIPQGGLDLESKRRDLGGMPGSVDINPQTPGGPAESNTVENFALYGKVLRLVRPNVPAQGPVIGGRDWRQVVTGQTSQTIVDQPLTVDSMRLFLMNK